MGPVLGRSIRVRGHDPRRPAGTGTYVAGGLIDRERPPGPLDLTAVEALERFVAERPEHTRATLTSWQFVCCDVHPRPELRRP